MSKERVSYGERNAMSSNNRWFIWNPHNIFQKDLTAFILIRQSEEEMA